jgi:hypothetical protein
MQLGSNCYLIILLFCFVLNHIQTLQMIDKCPVIFNQKDKSQHKMQITVKPPMHVF